MTGAFVMPVRTTTRQHTTPPKKNTTHSHYSATRPWPMPPPVKPWGQNDKELLQKLINRCKIDITRTSDTDYIDKICQKYFPPRDNHNF
jgi:hypothetical protein